MASIFLSLEQLVPTVIQQQHIQTISMATRLYHQVAQILAMARRKYLTHNQIFDTATPLYSQHDQVFEGCAEVKAVLEQVVRCYGQAVTQELLQVINSHNYDIASLQLNQVLGCEVGTIIQDLQFSAFIAGARVGVVSYTIDRSGFAILASLQLRDRADWANKQVGEEVVITLLGEQYNLMVANKLIEEQHGQGSYDLRYRIECISVSGQLAEGINPDISASRITASFPSGTWASEALDLLTDGVCTYTMSVPDFTIGSFEFENLERFTALRQIFPAEYGWIIETNKDGVLEIKSWKRPELSGAGYKTVTFSQKSLEPPGDVLYNQVELRNFIQQSGTSGLTLEVVDNGDGTGVIYGYSVPWTAAFSIFDSEDSPAPSLLITGGSVEEVVVEDTDVEFVDYAASLSKPCHSVPVIDWGNNDSLSPIIYTEAGALTTSTEPGYSVAVKVTYTTRRKVWYFENKKIDVSQVRLRYD